MRKIKNALSVIILLVTFILVIVLVFTRMNGETPEIFGYQLLRVSSSSMEPRLEVGDIILSKKINDITKVNQGDIITYNGEVGDFDGKTITHEVVVAPHLTDGTYYLQTKGTANDFPDPEIREDQVIGSMVCSLGVLSVIYDFFITPWGLIVVLGFLAILFINEIFALRQLVKENEDEEVKIENSSSQLVDDEEANNN